MPSAALLLSIHRLDGNVRKSRGIQFFADPFHIMVAVRGAGHETRRIVRKERRQRFGDDIGKLVCRKFGPIR